MTDNQQALQEAIQAIQYGERVSGRRLLAQLLRVDPENVQAWLWMSEVADTEAQRRECLEWVLTLQPNHERARTRLAQLDAHAATPAQQERQRVKRRIAVAGALALTLIFGVVLLLYTLLAVVPQSRARIERLSQPDAATATLWCPQCAQQGEPVLLRSNLGVGLFGAPVGELAHGTTVAVLDYQWSPLERRYYSEIAASGQRGWVPEALLRR